MPVLKILPGKAVTTITLMSPSTKPPKRGPLYHISEGKWFAEVCVGLAAYGDYDLGWVSTAFILLGLFTAGIFILAYLALALMLPVAPTLAKYAALRQPTTQNSDAAGSSK